MKNKSFAIHQELLVGLMLFGVGLYFFAGSLEYEGVPRLFPLLMSGIVIGFSVYNIYKGVQKSQALSQAMSKDSAVVPELSWGNLALPLKGFALIVIYVTAIPVFGFFSSTTVFMVACMYLLKYRNWLIMIVVTLGLEIFIYFLFVEKIMVRIPKGMFL